MFNQLYDCTSRVWPDVAWFVIYNIEQIAETAGGKMTKKYKSPKTG